MVWAVSYLQAPIAPFPQAVLALQPIAYWRLNEPDDQAYDGNPGAICHDYQSGNDALYTNVYLSNLTFGGTGYSPTTDPVSTQPVWRINVSSSGSVCRVPYRHERGLQRALRQQRVNS